MLFSRIKSKMPAAGEALPGRVQPLATATTHAVLGSPLGEVPAGAEVAFFGMGCFWGVERKFWQSPGVISTAVGYTGGATPNPTYDEVCSGRTGHNEVVRVVFDPTVTSYAALLKTFWEGHNPTQGFRQGNDTGTQYRSGIYAVNDTQLREAEASRAAYQSALVTRGFGDITTEIVAASTFYFAEGYHQQYLAKNPGGYCGVGGTGVSCPIGIGADDKSAEIYST